MTAPSPQSRRIAPRFGGFFSYVNVVFLVVGFLMWLILVRQFSDNYYKVIVVGLMLIAGGCVVVFMGRAANRVMALTIILLLVMTQIFIDSNRTLGIPTGVTRYPAPFVMFTGQPDAIYDEERDLQHNHLGYRGDVPGMPKHEDEFRILMIGGSTVYNGAPGHSLPDQLQIHLREQGLESAVVYNWGVVSQNSGMEASTIFNRAVNFDPDMVILYDGGNDIMNPYSWDPRPGYPFNFMLYERLPNMVQEGEFFAFTAGALAQVELLNLLFNEELSLNITPIEPLREEVDFQTPEWEAQLVTEYAANLERSCLLADAADFKLTVFLQPVVSFKTPRLGEEVRFYSSDMDFTDFVTREYAAARQELATLTRRHSADDTCYFIDVSRIYEGADFPVFTDYIHQNDEGRAFTANILAAHVMTLLDES